MYEKAFGTYYFSRTGELRHPGGTNRILRFRVWSNGTIWNVRSVRDNRAFGELWPVRSIRDLRPVWHHGPIRYIRPLRLVRPVGELRILEYEETQKPQRQWAERYQRRAEPKWNGLQRYR